MNAALAFALGVVVGAALTIGAPILAGAIGAWRETREPERVLTMTAPEVLQAMCTLDDLEKRRIVED